MRAVLVFPAAPLPFGDTAARWFHLLARDLLSRGHKVSCLTVTDEPRHKVDEARDRLAAVAPPGRLRFQAFPLRGAVHPVWRKLRNAVRPFSELVYAPGFDEAFERELARGYDVLHLEQLCTCENHADTIVQVVDPLLQRLHVRLRHRPLL